MQRPLAILWRWTLALAALLAVADGCEDLALRYRLAHNPASNLFEQVPIYEAGAVKGGKVEYYFDRPEVQVCVHAVFPHFGNAPCWYVRRHTMKLLSFRGGGALLRAAAVRPEVQGNPFRLRRPGGVVRQHGGQCTG